MNADTLTEEQIRQLRDLISEFHGVFSDMPGKTELACHDIHLSQETPIRSKAYRVSPRQRDIMAREIQRMLDLGVIEAAESDFTSPLTLVEVPGKEPRPCIDYSKLNAITVDQTYPIPNIKERTERVSPAPARRSLVSAARFISALDRVRGYWQVPLTETASRYAMFISPSSRDIAPAHAQLWTKKCPILFFQANGQCSERNRRVRAPAPGRHSCFLGESGTPVPSGGGVP